VRAFVLVCAAVLAAGLAGATAAQAAGRVAMVMVAEDYQKLQKSVIGTKRAGDIAEALKARGFDVTLSANPSNSSARANLRDFASKAAGADVAIVVLLGHGTTAMGQSFFLPVNTDVSVATDLLSRGIAVPSVAQIVAGAKTGGVFFLMTTPVFPTPVGGLNARPEFGGEIARNVVMVFSSSAKVPVSRVDAASEQAAEALATALQQPAPQFAELVKAAANEVGAVYGAPGDISLGKPAPAEVAVAPPAPPPVQQDAQKNAEVQAKLDSERVARETAERRAREDQSRAEKATAEVQRAQDDARKAQAEVAKAQADAKRAQADAERAQAEAEKAKAEARQIEAQAQLAKAQAEAEKAKVNMAATTAAAAPPAPPLDEKLLGQKQRQRIQERLREMSLYTGPIDSIMGPLTREAIMGYQRSRGAAVTGYLTPEQFQELVPGGT
jgi:hypothetical protein